MILWKGKEEAWQGFAVQQIMVMAILDVLAFYFYAMHIPEKQWPGRFNIWVSVYFPFVFTGTLTGVVRVFQLASHQMFHVLIVAAQFVFLYGLRGVMQRRCLQPGSPIAVQMSNETSLSL